MGIDYHMVEKNDEIKAKKRIREGEMKNAFKNKKGRGKKRKINI